MKVNKNNLLQLFESIIIIIFEDVIYEYSIYIGSFSVQCCCFRIRGRFAHSGVFFSLLSMMCALSGLYFYLKRSANRNVSPAESQNLNVECSVLDFFDNVSYYFKSNKNVMIWCPLMKYWNDFHIIFLFQHDVWHFFSAAGVFLRFSALLVLDDNLVNVERSKIPVF